MCPAILNSEQRQQFNCQETEHNEIDQRDQVLLDRLAAAISKNVTFIDSDEFREEDAPRTILQDPALRELSSTTAPRVPASRDRQMPQHLERLCRTPLLTQPQEAALFRRMNYLKYRATDLLWTVDSDSPDEDILNQIEAELANAKATRDQIIERNIRLVVSVVKKFVTPQISFDEMLSDGIVTLMATVEKFDYSRGFRFSTYAYRSIARAASRTVKNLHREKQRFSERCENELVDEKTNTQTEPVFHERRWEHERILIERLIGRLEPREQVIVSGRFALGDERKVQTLRAIALTLGISKERVRQLEQKALAKLQELAQTLFQNVAVDMAVV